MNYGQSSRAKKLILFIGVSGLLAFGVFWLSSHGFVEIQTEGVADSHDIGYRLTDPSTQTSSQSTAGASIKKLVKKGQKEILVQDGETGYFAVVNVGGFLGTTKVNVKLAPEKSRKYIGDNPAACLYYLEPVLASAQCSDLYSQLNLHVPATSSQPTYVQKGSSSNDGIVEGLVATSLGNVLLLESPDNTGHFAYLAKADLSLSNKTSLGSLSKDKSYSILPYKQGFVTFSKSFDDVTYYGSLTATPEKISVAKPKDTKLLPYSLSIQRDSIVTLYSNKTGRDVEANGYDSKTPIKQPKKITTTITISEAGKQLEFTIKKDVSTALLCGSDKLCLLNDKSLEVYDISSGKARFAYSVGGVSDIATSGNNLLVVKDESIVGLNVDNRSGNLQYTFGNYSYCGLSSIGLDYLLCISNDNKRAALLIDPKVANTDSIDKKILRISDSSIAQDLSIYGNNIFITPNVGDVIYLESEKSFGYDPAALQAAKGEIDKQVETAGIDRSVYTIINTLQ